MGRIFRLKVPFRLLVFLVIILIYWIWWLPGVRVANDFPLLSAQSLREQLDIPRLWHERGSEGLGEFGTFILWSWPFNFISGLLANIGMGFSTQLRVVYIIPIILLGIIGIRKILKLYSLSDSAVFISSVFYLSSTYLLLLIDGGQLPIALIYAFFPLLFVWTKNALTGNLKVKLSALLLVALITTFDVRFLFILVILFLVRFIFDLLVYGKEKWILFLRSYFLLGIVIGIGWLLLNIFWIFPFVNYPISANLYVSLTQTVGVEPTTWKHALLLLQPQWYKNVFGKIEPIQYQFILIPLLAFLAPVLNFIKKDKKWFSEIVFWSSLAILGVFLTKGSNPPYSGIYNFLYTYIPGFSLFRDSTKFFFLVALSYSVLIAFSIDYIRNMLTKLRIKNRFVKSYILNPKLFIFILTCYFLFLIYPIYTVKMTGMFSIPIYEKESSVVSDIIEKDNSFSRIFYIPSRVPLGYSSPMHPSVEALRMLSKRPFTIGTVGTYEQFNYLREAPFMGEIFSVSGIKYLYYPYPDPRREHLKQDNIDYYYTFLDQLSALPWMEKTISVPPVSVLQTKKVKDHIFTASNSFYVVGSDRIYWDLMKIEGFDLSNNALIFTEENPGLIGGIEKTNQILLYDKDQTDLLISFIDGSNMFFPANFLGRDPTEKQKFWKRGTSDLIWWRDFLQTKYGIDNLDFDYGGGWAVGEGDQQLVIGKQNLIKGNILFARVMKSSRSGKIQFWQGDNMIGEINTLISDPEKVEIKLSGYKDIPDKISTYDKADFNWYEVGRLLDSDLPLIIRTSGDINVINVMATFNEDVLNVIKNRIKILKNDNRIITWDVLYDKDKQMLFNRTSNRKMSYKKIDSTKYEVEVSLLDSPSYLIFSETFDENWELNGRRSKPVYSLANGFYIDKPGKYTLYFTPQKYVYSGLIISVITMFSLVGTFIYLGKRKKI